jgi:NADPH2:quinone reductase
MRAVVITNAGPDGHLEVQDLPVPALTAGSIRIDVRAAGVNHADIAQRQGRYAQHATQRGRTANIGGLEVSGVVSEVAAGVTRWQVGDEVMAMCAGGYAEQVVVDERLALRKPATLSWAEAAAVPVAFVTAHDALVTAGQADSSKAVLITGASSAVGYAAGQIAQMLNVGRLVGTASSEEKRRQLMLGPFDEVFNYTAHPIESIEQVVGSVDVVIDMIAGDWLPALLETMNVSARFVSVGRLRGSCVEFNLDVVARKRLVLVGVSFRSRSLDEYAATVRRAADFITQPLGDGRLLPSPVTSYELDEARAAQDELAARPTPGKSVLHVHD